MVGRLAFLTGLAAFALASPAAAQTLRVPPGLAGVTPVLREFQDWLLVCDNVRVCRAQPKSPSGSLMVRRDPGPDGNLIVVLDGQDPTSGPSVPDLTSIALAGARLATSAPWRFDSDREAAVLEGEAALRFVRAAADAATIRYRASGETLEVSLSGMKAALLAMEEAQGRLGTPSAFVRPGRRAEADVSPPIDVPVVTASAPPSGAALPTAFVTLVRQASARWIAEEECPARRIEADSAYPLTTSEAIVILACGTGTHSTGYIIVRASHDARPSVRRVVLPPPPRREEEADYYGEVYTDVEWDPATASLYSSSYSCAHTCGENSRWVFDGRDFVLAGHLIYEGGGAEVLELYRTEVRVRR